MTVAKGAAIAAGTVVAGFLAICAIFGLSAIFAKTAIWMLTHCTFLLGVAIGFVGLGCIISKIRG